MALSNEGSFGTDGWGGDHFSEKPLYSFLPDSLKNDVEIALAAINSNSKCIPFLVKSVLDNEEVLGLIKAIKSLEENKQETTDKGSSVVHFKFQLDKPVIDDLYNYIITS